MYLVPSTKRVEYYKWLFWLKFWPEFRANFSSFLTFSLSCSLYYLPAGILFTKRNKNRACAWHYTQYSFYPTCGRVKTIYKNITSSMKPRLTATSVIRSPRYYGHFFWLIGDRINGVPLYNRIQVTRVDVIGVCILALRRLVRMDTTELAHLLFAWIISDGRNSHQKTSPWNSDNNWTELDSL